MSFSWSNHPSMSWSLAWGSHDRLIHELITHDLTVKTLTVRCLTLSLMLDPDWSSLHSICFNISWYGCMCSCMVLIFHSSPLATLMPGKWKLMSQYEWTNGPDGFSHAESQRIQALFCQVAALMRLMNPLIIAAIMALMGWSADGTDGTDELIALMVLISWA